MNDDDILNKWRWSHSLSPIGYVTLVIMIGLGIWLFNTVSEGRVNDRIDFFIVALLTGVPLFIMTFFLLQRIYMKKDKAYLPFKNSQENSDSAYSVIQDTLKKLGFKYRTEEKGSTTAITSFGQAVFILTSAVEPLEIFIQVLNERYLAVAIWGVTKDNKFQVEKLQKELYYGLIKKGIYID